jgi:hypothetical protein
MSTNLNTSLRNSAAKISQFVENAAEMSVETKFVVVSDTGATEAKQAAKTVVKLDGDSETTVPLQEGDGGRLEVDVDLYAVHERNVATAIEYRARILQALMGAFATITGRAA